MDKRLTASILGAIFVVGFVSFFFALHAQPDTTLSFTPETPQPYKPEPNVFTGETPISELETVDGLVKFSSDDEIRQFLLDASKRYGTEVAYSTGSGIPFGFAPEPRSQFGFEETLDLAQRSSDASLREGGAVPAPYGTSTEYSTTNVQVANVDEADYLKNDGKYLYILSQNTLTIIEAYPAERAKVLLKIGLDIEPQELQNMFLNDDRLVIFYRGSGQAYGIDEFDFEPRPVYHSKTFATILDVSDRENPSIVTKYEVDGDYHNSRMIGDMVYLLTTNYADYNHPIIPRILTQERMIAPDVYHFPNPEESYNFNTVTAFDISGNFKNSETFLMGYTNTIYVSEDNLYITYQKNIPPSFYEDSRKDRFFDVVVPLLPKVVQEKIKEIQNDPKLDSYAKWNMVSNLLQETYNKMPKEDRERLFNEIRKALDEYDRRIQEDVRRTAIHKIALDDGNLSYISHGEVSGYPLNQFSMDEHNGKFRIATTSESYSMHGSTLSNNVYVLDNELKIIGSLEKIAKDESIYSARFLGDKLYLVTFQRIDPFFVIDLSQDKPNILGELKIPGFSQYLHPYDEHHIIGIGRDTKEHKEGWVETLGVKLSLYDVSDFDNPKEVDAITIGDSSIDSEILYNHKAFLLDKNKNIMSIPIKGSTHEPVPLGREGYYPSDKLWYGFYVYGINGDGFELKGKIAHYNTNAYPTVYMQSRSFYIDNTLYTVMDGSVKMNDINDIDNEVNSLKLLQTGKLVKIID